MNREGDRPPLLNKKYNLLTHKSNTNVRISVTETEFTVYPICNNHMYINIYINCHRPALIGSSLLAIQNRLAVLRIISLKLRAMCEMYWFYHDVWFYCTFFSLSKSN